MDVFEILYVLFLCVTFFVFVTGLANCIFEEIYFARVSFGTLGPARLFFLLIMNVYIFPLCLVCVRETL